MNGYHNGINGHMEELEEGCTFLFTSESVGEGHPGKLFRFTPRPHVSSAIFYTIVREFFLHVHTSKKPFSNIVSSANSVWCHDATGCNEQTFASSLRRRPCKPRAAVTPCEYLPLRDVFTFFFCMKTLGPRQVLTSADSDATLCNRKRDRFGSIFTSDGLRDWKMNTKSV